MKRNLILNTGEMVEAMVPRRTDGPCCHADCPGRRSVNIEETERQSSSAWVWKCVYFDKMMGSKVPSARVRSCMSTPEYSETTITSQERALIDFCISLNDTRAKTTQRLEELVSAYKEDNKLDIKPSAATHEVQALKAEAPSKNKQAKPTATAQLALESAVESKQNPRKSIWKADLLRDWLDGITEQLPGEGKKNEVSVKEVVWYFTASGFSIDTITSISNEEVEKATGALRRIGWKRKKGVKGPKSIYCRPHMSGGHVKLWSGQ